MVSLNEFFEFLGSGCLLSSGADDLWLGWGTPVRSSQASLERLSLYAPDFFLRDESPWWQFPNSRKIKREELLVLTRRFCEEIFPENLWNDFKSKIAWTKSDRRAFQTAFDELKKRFQAGVLRKGVPIVIDRADFPIEKREKAKLLAHVLQATLGWPIWVYGFWNQNEGILGATPELLFEKREDGSLRTMALAGTRPRQANQSAGRKPLLEDAKELEEHRIVIEGIRSSLQNWGTQQVGNRFEIEVGQTQELVLPTLTHLITPISCLVGAGENLFQANAFKKLIESLHPTPALGAYPRESGWQWLQAYANPEDRQRFGAPFGVLTSSGEILCIVSIRNIQWKSGRVFLAAGCGVVPASDCDREWKEFQSKTDSVKGLLGL